MSQNLGLLCCIHETHGHLTVSSEACFYELVAKLDELVIKFVQGSAVTQAV